MLIIEGLDATGKSTLANSIAAEFNLRIQESEGPPVDNIEFLSRIERYFDLKNTVFVRHPLVSNPIYDLGRPAEKRIPIPQSYFEAFYSQPNIFIYCARTDLQVSHDVKAHDTPEHLEMIKAKDELLHRAYKEWALRHANIVYRIGDDVGAILEFLRGTAFRYQVAAE